MPDHKHREGLHRYFRTRKFSSAHTTIPNQLDSCNDKLKPSEPGFSYTKFQCSMGGKERRANWSPFTSGSTTPFLGSEHCIAGNLPGYCWSCHFIRPGWVVTALNYRVRKFAGPYPSDMRQSDDFMKARVACRTWIFVHENFKVYKQKRRAIRLRLRLIFSWATPFYVSENCLAWNLSAHRCSCRYHYSRLRRYRFVFSYTKICGTLSIWHVPVNLFYEGKGGGQTMTFRTRKFWGL